MTLLGIRPHARGYVVGPVRARLRDDRLGTEVRPAQHVRTRREAMATLTVLLRQARHAHDHGYDHIDVMEDSDMLDMMVNHQSLKPQTQRVLGLLVQRGSLTSLEALHAGAGFRLAARVKEIREAFGDDAVVTEQETDGDARYARYHWCGDIRMAP